MLYWKVCIKRLETGSSITKAIAARDDTDAIASFFLELGLPHAFFDWVLEMRTISKIDYIKLRKATTHGISSNDS